MGSAAALVPPLGPYSRGVRGLRGLLIVLAVAAAVVGGCFVVVGFVAPGRGFDWMTTSVFGTAVGTTLLAFVTGVLAYSTRSDVRASQLIAEGTRRQAQAVLRSTELAEEARAEQLRPLLVGTVTRLDEDDEGYLASVELHNIGGGAALRIEATVLHAYPTIRARTKCSRGSPPVGRFRSR